MLVKRRFAKLKAHRSSCFNDVIGDVELRPSEIPPVLLQ